MRLTHVVRKAQQAASTPLYVIPLASGGAPYREWTTKIIRFIRHGCANRPFFHIAVQEGPEEPQGDVIEQIGTYDPFPNQYNEKLVAVNLVRLEHWLRNGAIMSTPVKKILGLAGYCPIHPKTLSTAWERRKLLMDTLTKLEAEAAAAAAAASTSEFDASVGKDVNLENESPKDPGAAT